MARPWSSASGGGSGLIRGETLGLALGGKGMVFSKVQATREKGNAPQAVRLGTPGCWLPPAGLTPEHCTHCFLGITCPVSFLFLCLTSAFSRQTTWLPVLSVKRIAEVNTVRALFWGRHLQKDLNSASTSWVLGAQPDTILLGLTGF